MMASDWNWLQQCSAGDEIMPYQITFSIGDYRNTQGSTSIQQKSSKKKGYNERLHIRAVCFSAREDWNLSIRLLLISWGIFELILEISDLLCHEQRITQKTYWNQARMRAKGEGVLYFFFVCLRRKQLVFFSVSLSLYFIKINLFYLKVHSSSARLSVI